MTKLMVIFISACLLMGCASIPIPPSATPTLTSTETPTTIPSRTPRPTATHVPTATAIPPLPATIEFTFDKSISEELQNKIKAMVDEAYWYFLSQGCAPDGFKANFYIGKGGYGDYVDGFVKMDAGVSGQGSNLLTSESDAISHEVAHTMCQHAFTKRGNLGTIDLRWLTEGVANYFYPRERITNTGVHFGITSIDEWNRATVEGLPNNFCTISPLVLEPSNADKLYPDNYYLVSDAATALLVKTTPDGINAILHYYKLLNQETAAQSFQEAFGRTKEEFYKQYLMECIDNFPSVKN